MPRKPDWICIGAQKAATTWLSRMLSAHHKVWVPDGAEVAFFDLKILEQPLSWYESLFDDPQGTATIAGEKTPRYSCLKPQSIAFVKRYLPDVKLILILRRPDERAWSQARMETSKGRHFNERNLTAGDINRCIFHLGTVRNTRYTRYDRILANWRRHFPPEQLLILFHEEIEQQPRAVLEQICEFLEIEFSPTWTDDFICSRVWVSPSLEIPAAARWYLQRRYRSMIKTLSQDYGQPVTKWLDPPPASIRVSFWQKLKVTFRADVATIPFNVAYRCYNAFRHLRMFFRLRRLGRAVAQAASPPQTAVRECTTFACQEHA
ncbi:MAG: sulfotransferase family protein [Pirellulales bacterium]